MKGCIICTLHHVLDQASQTRGPPVHFMRPLHWSCSNYRMWPTSELNNFFSRFFLSRTKNVKGLLPLILVIHSCYIAIRQHKGNYFSWVYSRIFQIIFSATRGARRTIPGLMELENMFLLFLWRQTLKIELMNLQCDTNLNQKFSETKLQDFHSYSPK
jgi:hypothetical protein